MTDSVQQSNDAQVTARLIALINQMSPARQRALLGLVEDWQHTRRREHTRESCFLAVDYGTRDGVFKDFITNMSAGGVFIETRMPFAVGQEVTLTFSSSNYEDPVKITGKIAWGGPRGIGVKFSEVTLSLEALRR
jgi:Tfp pilus assembly protein PilZ